ncbi:MAG TPA: circadian clock protein KaiC [Polyangiaceae bacterium]|nr:circadian clock protein KaiC [Polyangiaceae bacterium]
MRLSPAELPELEKAPTGITGFDEITRGGLPKRRPTLICGGAGCGKTLFGLHFLVRGATEYGEPGVFIAFEEREEDLIQNVASLGFDLNDLVRRKLIGIDHIRVERREIEESGEYDLEGLFLRLDHAINQVGAKRVVIDTLEVIFGGFTDQTIVRSELRRLFQWLEERSLTTVITGERGDGALTRHGLEEYVSDCVVLLDHRVLDQVSTRRVRVIKYRGTKHETNEFPFLIDQSGITVVPITSVDLDYAVSDERVGTGLLELDDMLSGGGYYRGSCVLITGSAGTGKSSLCAHFADATCRAGERCLYISYEESPLQLQRNMRSIGLDLKKWQDAGLLRIVSLRSTNQGFEGHLALLQKQVAEFGPSAVILDPFGTMLGAGSAQDAELMLVRMVDALKAKGITMLLSSVCGSDAREQTSAAVSSLADTWLLLEAVENDGERHRCLHVLESRGMAHSNQVREFLITSRGIDWVEPHGGAAGVLTGTARAARALRGRLAAEQQTAEESRWRLLERKRQVLEQRVAALRAEFAAEEAELEAMGSSARASLEAWDGERVRLGLVRGASSQRGASTRDAPRNASGPPPASRTQLVSESAATDASGDGERKPKAQRT